MKLKFKFFALLSVLLRYSKCVVQKQIPNEPVVETSDKNSSEIEPLQKYKFPFAKFPFKGVKSQILNFNVDTPKTKNVNPDQTKKDEAKVNNAKPLKTYEHENGLEEWWFNLDNCRIDKVAKKEGEKENPNIPEPQIEVLLYDRETGTYNTSVNGGYENAYHYDPLNKMLRDDTPELGFGLKIGDYFIERERLKIEDYQSVESLINLNILKGTTMHGMDATLVVYDKPGNEKKEMLKVKCYQTFLKKMPIVSSVKTTVKMMGIWVMLGFWLVLGH